MTELDLSLYPKLKHCKIYGPKIEGKVGLISSEERILKLLANHYFFDEMFSKDTSRRMVILIKELNNFNVNVFDLCSSLNTKEAYGISIENKDITIYGDSDRAYFYGLLTLKDLMNSGLLHEKMYILDYPSMNTRGIIEGFYGKPWTLEERISAIEHISSARMNTYIYAPKDDKYHREKWDELYPEDVLESIEKVCESSKNNLVDFYYTVGPGLSIKYSNTEDIEKLYQKYFQLYNLGIRHFGILFDDIPSRLMHEEDKYKFKELAFAHAKVVNELYSRLTHLDKENKLVLCGTVYSGRGNEDYLVKLGVNVPAEVDILWTGRSVCSQELDSRDAICFFENIGHKPLYWDNYPVNDANMQYELHLGPIIGRDIDLHRYSEGLISNVMEYKEASMIPIITVAHYLWNSEAYESNKSLDVAIKKIVGEKDFEQFKKFNLYCLKSCLNPIGSEDFIEKVILFKCASSKSRHEFIKTLKEMSIYFKGNVQAADYLQKNMTNRKLYCEVKPWLNKFMKFNLFCNYMVEYILCTLYANKVKGILLAVKAFLLYRKLQRNPVQMMNFEAQVLMESGKS